MDNKAPAFQLYAADFYMDTASWSPESVGFYFRLLIYQWVNGSIPTDIEGIARIAGCMENRKWRTNVARMWRECGHKFATLDNGNSVRVYKNLRLEEEREKQRKYREKQSQKGKIGAEKRWEGVTGDMATDIATAIPEPIPKDSSSVFSLQSSLITSKEEHCVLPDRNEIENFSSLKLDKEEEKVCLLLYQQKIFKGVFSFRNTMLADGINKRALLYVLVECAKRKPKKPWPYCVNILKKENGNFTAKEYEKDY